MSEIVIGERTFDIEQAGDMLVISADGVELGKLFVGVLEPVPEPVFFVPDEPEKDPSDTTEPGEENGAT